MNREEKRNDFINYLVGNEFDEDPAFKDTLMDCIKALLGGEIDKIIAENE